MSNYLKDSKLMEEYNHDKNVTFDINKLTLGSKKKIWWKCKECDNEWEAVIYNRMKGTGCPVCSQKKIGQNRINSLIKNGGSLADKRPDLLQEWNYEKNGDLRPEHMTCGSHKKVWWKCRNGHEWQAVVYNRSNGTGCPKCHFKTKSYKS